jgi:hypothetical protein
VHVHDHQYDGCLYDDDDHDPCIDDHVVSRHDHDVFWIDDHVVSHDDDRPAGNDHDITPPDLDDDGATGHDHDVADHDHNRTLASPHDDHHHDDAPGVRRFAASAPTSGL